MADVVGVTASVDPASDGGFAAAAAWSTLLASVSSFSPAVTLSPFAASLPCAAAAGVVTAVLACVSIGELECDDCTAFALVGGDLTPIPSDETDVCLDFVPEGDCTELSSSP